VATSSGEGNHEPDRHRLDLLGNRPSTGSSTSFPSPRPATTSSARRSWPANAPKARPRKKPDAPTNASSQTALSAACGPTTDASSPPQPISRRQSLDKGASQPADPGPQVRPKPWSPPWCARSSPNPTPLLRTAVDADLGQALVDLPSDFFAQRPERTARWLVLIDALDEVVNEELVTRLCVAGRPEATV
jgi:hypothetical protein